MLGERGLWFKMCFFEGSARVPMMIASSTMEPGLIKTPVSTIDVTPTLCDIAGISMDDVMPWTDGESIVSLGQGGTRTSPVMMEYAAEASYAPLVALRQGDFKYTNCKLDAEQLFDVQNDPHELTDLAKNPAHTDTLERLRTLASERWDLERFDQAVRASQARRWVVYEALRNGNYYPWDFQPLQKASERYMRNHMDLNTVEDIARFPRGE
jgi:choline-sulfatase